jgi:hypothetical protein
MSPTLSQCVPEFDHEDKPTACALPIIAALRDFEWESCEAPRSTS